MLITGNDGEQDKEAGQQWLARADAYDRRSLVRHPTGEEPPFPAARTDSLRDICERAASGSWWGMVQLGAAAGEGPAC